MVRREVVTAVCHRLRQRGYSSVKVRIEVIHSRFRGFLFEEIFNRIIIVKVPHRVESVIGEHCSVAAFGAKQNVFVDIFQVATHILNYLRGGSPVGGIAALKIAAHVKSPAVDAVFENI